MQPILSFGWCQFLNPCTSKHACRNKENISIRQTFLKDNQYFDVPKKSNYKNHLIFKVYLLAQTTSICLNDVSDKKKNICNTVFITYDIIAQAWSFSMAIRH